MTRRPHASPQDPAQLPVACRGCPLLQLQAFRRCSTRELSFVTGMKRRQVSVSAGTELRPGAKDGVLYTLYEGWATRIYKLADGSRQILDFVLPGELVGLPVALLGSSAHTVEAVTAITLCELDSRRLPTLFQGHPELALAILKTSVLEQERADRRLASLGRMGAAERIAYLMLDLHHRLLRLGVSDARSLPFPLQRNQIADAVGLSKVHVMRALKELRELELAAIEGHKLIIPNIRKLARFCSFVPVQVSAGS